MLLFEWIRDCLRWKSTRTAPDCRQQVETIIKENAHGKTEIPKLLQKARAGNETAMTQLLELAHGSVIFQCRKSCSTRRMLPT